MTIEVSVKPRSAKPGIATEGDRLIVRVREPAIDGAANEACIRALAEHFGVAASRIRLVRGHRSRLKLLTVEGL